MRNANLNGVISGSRRKTSKKGGAFYFVWNDIRLSRIIMLWQLMNIPFPCVPEKIMSGGLAFLARNGAEGRTFRLAGGIQSWNPPRCIIVLVKVME